MSEYLETIREEIIEIYNLANYPVEVEDIEDGKLEISMCPVFLLMHGFKIINWKGLYLPFVYKGIKVICLPEKQAVIK